MTVLQDKTRRILMVTAVTAALTAGGTGLAFAYADPGAEPQETGYMVVDEAAATDDCPYGNAGAVALTHSDGARL
jgi:hypothetical protein